MSYYLEGYVRARQTMAEIERGRHGIGPATDRPNSRALERWLGGLTAMVRRTVPEPRKATVRSRLSSA